MKISTLKRKIQKIGSDLESYTQKIDLLMEDIEDDDCIDMLDDILGKLEDIIEEDVPKILDHIDENLNLEETEQ